MDWKKQASALTGFCFCAVISASMFSFLFSSSCASASGNRRGVSVSSSARIFSSNPLNAANGANAAGILLRIYNALNRVSVIIVIAAIVLIFSLLDRIKELLLRLSLHFKPVNERIIRLYGNLIKVAGNSAGEDLTSYTPDLLREYLLSEKGVAPEKLIELFKKTAFGGYDCTQEEYSAAYKEYKKCLRQIRRPASRQKAKGAQTEA